MKPFQTQGYVFVQARVMGFVWCLSTLVQGFFWSLLTAEVKYFPFLPQENREYHKEALFFFSLFWESCLTNSHIRFKPVLRIFFRGQRLCQVFACCVNT